MYIEDMEVCALHSRSVPLENLKDTTSLDPPTSTKGLLSKGPPPFTLEHYPTLPLSSNFPPSSFASSPPFPPENIVSQINNLSSSPCEAKAFKDPSLLTSLSIFSDKSPISPSTTPLDSIRLKNVTIWKSKKPPSEAPGDSGNYTPLSTRLKNVAR